MYGRGENSIAEQLGCTVEEARDIKNNVYDKFPGIKRFERASAAMVKQRGFVTTLWGRKRRLPDYNLPTYEFEYVEKDASDKYVPAKNKIVPESIKSSLINKLNTVNWKAKSNLIQDILEKKSIRVIDNGGKIADASRQIINSRVQGCIDGDTVIISKDFGKVKVRDFVDSTIILWDGNEWTNGTIVSSGKKKKCIIHLDDGTDFVCSPDHKFKVVLEDGSFVWKKCSELKPSDEIESFDKEI